MKDNRILILVPGVNARGGITNYYKSLTKYFTLPVDYLLRGSRSWPYRENLVSETIRIVKDIWIFFLHTRTKKYTLVQTNTSFSSWALYRDAAFILIAKFSKLKIIVFFRGWDQSLAERIGVRHLRLFKKVYFQADAIIDLSKKNIERLEKWGFKKPIYLETTVVDKELVKDISLDYLNKKYDLTKRKMSTILYLSRIERTKGIYEAIEAFRLLLAKYPYLQLSIAGDGREDGEVRNFIKRNNIKNTSFTGYIEGNEKRKVFMEADIYLFPSYYEGMPNSVLEAMAFGLPVVATNVGGLPDFFINGTFGYITDDKQPEVLAELIEKIMVIPELGRKMSLNNYKYANEQFLSDKVVKRIESIYELVIKS